MWIHRLWRGEARSRFCKWENLRTMQRILAAVASGWHDGRKPQVLKQQASKAQMLPRWLSSYCGCWSWKEEVSRLKAEEAWIEREKPEKLLEAEQDTDSTENAGKTLPKSKWVALCSQYCAAWQHHFQTPEWFILQFLWQTERKTGLHWIFQSWTRKEWEYL